ncbi:MAG: LuxR C-terminal-related transcriptional regulator, partial [Actinomycetes bacterium]
GRALRFADLLDIDARIDLLLKRSYECYLIDALADSIAALDQAVTLLRETTRRDGLAQALLRLSRVHWTAGHSNLSDDLREEALTLLEALPPGPTLARAYGAQASSFMVAGQYEQGIEWGERALALARELGAQDVEVHVLNTLGVCRWGSDPVVGEALLLESVALGRELDLEDDVARGYANLAGQALGHLDVPKGLAYCDEGAAYCVDHDLHGTLLCILTGKLAALSRIGEWAEATKLARNLLEERAISRVSRAEPLMALGLVRSRRGDPEVWPALDEAELCVREAYELQFQAPVALSRAEAHWLEGDVDAAEAALLPVLELARRTADRFFLGDLEVMLWRLGRQASEPQTQSEVHRLVLAGEHRAAAAYWVERGYCYDAALALADSDDETDLRNAVVELDRLGAKVLVARTAAKSRSLGFQGVPRGARASTRANVGGLTDREAQVLSLLDQGLRNVEIAQRLHLSEKTVGHHVSSILAKLGVASRGEAVLRARELATAS